MQLVKQLAAIRHAKHMTQAELGERIGRTAMAVAHWEAGRRQPSVKTLVQIAEALGVPVNKLIDK